jgi:hypothetical protein
VYASVEPINEQENEEENHMASFTRTATFRTIVKLLGIALLITSSSQPFASQPPRLFAQSSSGSLRLVRIMETARLALVDPTALLYVPTTEHFLVPTAATESTGATISVLSPYEDRLATASAPADLVGSPLAYDRTQEQLVALRRSSGQLERIQLQPNGLPDWRSSTALTARPVNGVSDGLAVAANGALFLLNSSGWGGAQTVQQLMPITDAPARAGADAFARATITLEATNARSLRGLAIHPQSGHLFTLAPATQSLYEFTPTGQLITVYDLAPFGLRALQGLAFAPSGDQTDDPSQIALYIVDRDPAITGTTTGTTPAAAQPNGRIAELSFTPLPAAVVGAATDVATLVRTVETSKFSPPSPDPADLTYIPTTPYVNISNVLLLSDSEVNEMNIYAGANIFQTTLAGVLQTTYTTVPDDITEEPAGLTFNPNNGHLFLTDDDNIRPLIEIKPGPDKTYLTADDTFTKVSLRDSPNYGNNDPEGVEYTRIGGVDTLFMVDGLNSELYVAQPGPNGIFDGTDDVVSHYDTLSKGVSDPEGIAYHPQTGTLYLVGKPATRVAELTITGELVRYVDIAAANADKPAGLTFAPASNNPNALHLYAVDRGVDNDSDSKENDGLMYEFAIPSGSNQPPLVDAGAALTIDWPTNATLDGTVTDDGLPAPAALTTSWSKVSGPGDVTFGDATAVDTTAAFTAPGTYELQLSAFDGELTGNDSVIVTAEAVNVPPTITISPAEAIELSASITLTATIADDGLPVDPGTVTVAWQKLNGPGTVTFSSSTSSVTSASFTEVGRYVIQATAHDGELSSSATVTITVTPTNLPPNVEAGLDQAIDHGDSAQLSGTVSDDGLPNPPGALTIAWSKLDGPGAVTFSTANAPATAASFTAMGTYRLALTVSDGKATVSDQLTITVAPPNQEPVVDAGPNVTGTIGMAITLRGSATDDGLPNPPGRLAVRWTVSSGAGEVTFADATAANTTVTVDQTGIYILQLTGDDGRLQATDIMSINVGVANQPPALVTGGGPTIITTSTAISLSVLATDEWIPAASGELSYAWAMVSGPSTPTFGTPNGATTTVRFTKSGEYRIRVTVSDGELSSTADFAITVNAPNFPPQITLSSALILPTPGTLELSAVVTDDGQPEPNRPLTYQWSMSAGPAPVRFATPTALTTLAEFSQTGVYTLTLRASDGAMESIGTLVVTVGPENLSVLYLPLIR